MALNTWVDEFSPTIDAFLAQIVADGGAGAPAHMPVDRTSQPDALCRLAQLFVQYRDRLEPDMAAKVDSAACQRFKLLLNDCGNPFRTTGAEPGAKKVLTALLQKRRQGEQEFMAECAKYAWPSAFAQELFAREPGEVTSRMEGTVTLCALLSNDKFGVPCAPKIGKKENRVVFVARDSLDWLAEHLKLDRTTHGTMFMQDLLNAELVAPWQVEKREKKGGVKFEDGDRFFWFDYVAITRWRAAMQEKRDALVYGPEDARIRAELEPYQLDRLGSLGLLASITGSEPGAGCLSNVFVC